MLSPTMAILNANFPLFSPPKGGDVGDVNLADY